MPSLFRPFFTYNASSVVVEDTSGNIGLDIKNGITLANPTGVDPTREQWKELSKIAKDKKFTPFFDMVLFN